MIDLFSLALSHALLLFAAWRIVRRPDLDREPPAAPPSKAGPGKAPPHA